LESLFTVTAAEQKLDKNDPFQVIAFEYKTHTRSKVWVDEKALGVLGEELRFYLGRDDSTSAKLFQEGMPLQFDSDEEQIGFVFLMEALRFGSCYDRLLEQKTRSKRGAKETIQFGLMSMFISGKPPQMADNLINCSTPHEIATNFDFPIHESQALDFAKLGGVYKDVDGPLTPFANAISRIMNELGMLLRSRQMNHLGQLALQIYSQTDKSGWSFAKALAKALPITFGDESHGLSFLSKAQRTATVLGERFPQKFQLVNTNRMTALADAELVFSLRKLGVIRLISELEQKIDSENANRIPAGSKEEFSLRVGALDAVHKMTKGQIRNPVASEWIIEKAVNIVSTTCRIHLTETLAY
jgi:hypothetical protein